jgi:dipeptidyl aminopeptidase/acylaminoacyl peptidase
MLVWVILPPNFDATKKYPTLYTVKVVHKVLTQFYLFPLEFSIAAWLYVVAPNRRGMPGHGVEWNEQISKDWV